MKMKLFILIISILALTGCVQYTMEEVLLQRSEISLTWKGDIQIEYNPDSYQIGYNETKKEYRVCDDRLANWFVIRFSQVPSSPGQVLDADVTWTGKTAKESFTDLEFTVEQTDDEGKIWMWNEYNNIGIIIKHIK